LRIEERTKVFNFTSVATKAGTVIAICLALPIIGRTTQAYFAGIAAVELLLVLGLTAGLFSRGMLSLRAFDKQLFRAGLLFGIPLVLYEFAFAVLGSADRFMVRHYLGADALGFYSVANGLARNVNELLVAPLGLAILPIYMRLWNSDGATKTAEFLNTALNWFVLAAIGIVAIVAGSAQPLVLLLASSRYAGAERLVPIVLAALLVYASHVFVAAGLLIHKKTLQMAGVLALAAAFNVALNAVLLPRMGLIGGALASLLSCSACIAALGLASSRYLKLRLHASSVAKYLVAAIAAWAASFALQASSTAITLLVRGTVACVVYVASLYVCDSQVRAGCHSAGRRVHALLLPY
jgi:O-antigen/teichoic acid export membrane protein